MLMHPLRAALLTAALVCAVTGLAAQPDPGDWGGRRGRMVEEQLKANRKST